MTEGYEGSMCKYSGHEWQKICGGLLLCPWCEAEKWDDALDHSAEPKGREAVSADDLMEAIE